MNYLSTRDAGVRAGAAQAIFQGISKDGGLFVPERLPRLDNRRIKSMVEMDYRQRATEILPDFLGGFTKGEIAHCVNSAYGGQFCSPKVAPLLKLSPNIYMLELWHGPTCAFKDMALQILPHLLTCSAKKVGGGKTVNILVATSGDTGKAALEGFRDVSGTNILVFYPSLGVSEIQKLQMITQDGGNVSACGVAGNFDDTQTGVKKIFADPDLQKMLEDKNAAFSSANSINWGRLVPQIVYYVSAYCDLIKEGEIKQGDKINIAVPTGNFGNILAAFYAKRMGLPVNKLICASNINNVLTDFIESGVYDRRREFYPTSSPSMDILISSNLERLLFSLGGGDPGLITGMMGLLSEEGMYTVPASIKKEVGEEFVGGYCGEQDTFAEIKNTFLEYGYLCDTHTAVGLRVYRDYAKITGDGTKTVIASTASPFKFAGNILPALTGEEPLKDEFACVEKLAEISGMEPPAQILELKSKPVRFERICEKEDMPLAVRDFLESK
jgi:threonine synthase